MTLQDWFVQKTKRPLMNLGTTVLVIFLLFATYAIGTYKENIQNSMRDIMVTTITIGVQQNNRELIESALSRSVNDLGAKSAFLCKNNEVIISNRLSVNRCSDISPASFLENVLKFNLSGFSDYEVYFIVPKYRFNGESFWILLITPIFIIFCWYIIARIQKNFIKDILWPLDNNLLTDKPLDIMEFRNLRDKIKTLSENKEKEIFREAVAESKKAFAHNVKSPLRNLKLIRSKLTESIDNDEIRLFDSAINQITNMADKLNVKANIGEFRKGSRNTLALVDLNDTLQMCARNKTHEWSNLGKGISLNVQANSQDLAIATVDPNELKALFSNLFNNAQEAGATQIDCSVTISDANILVDIVDNGSGVARSIQESIFNEGITHGKPNGTGYGLYHARKYLQSWLGDIYFMGSSASGTRFRINLPLWRVPKIAIDENDTIVIFEDKDIEVERIKKSITLSKKTNRILHFKNHIELFKWYERLPESEKSIVLLADYDLGEDSLAGTDVIRSLKKFDKSVLITDSHEDARIYDLSKTMDVPLVPKSIIERVSLFS